jgi:hypothetical protein
MAKAQVAFAFDSLLFKTICILRALQEEQVQQTQELTSYPAMYFGSTFFLKKRNILVQKFKLV